MNKQAGNSTQMQKQKKDYLITSKLCSMLINYYKVNVDEIIDGRLGASFQSGRNFRAEESANPSRIKAKG